MCKNEFMSIIEGRLSFSMQTDTSGGTLWTHTHGKIAGDGVESSVHHADMTNREVEKKFFLQ